MLSRVVILLGGLHTMAFHQPNEMGADVASVGNRDATRFLIGDLDTEGFDGVQGKTQGYETVVPLNRESWAEYDAIRQGLHRPNRARTGNIS